MSTSLKSYVPNRFEYVSVLGIPMRVKRIKIQQECDISLCNPQSNVAQFTLPTSNILDFSRGSFRFTAVLGKTGGTYVRASNNIQTAIERIAVIVGGQTLVDERQWNLQVNIPTQVVATPNWQNSVGFIMQGVGTQAQRNSYAAGKQYEIPLSSGILTSQPLPLPVMSEQVLIKIYWASPSDWIETDGTNPTFNITGMQLFFDQYQFPAGTNYIEALRAKMMSSGKIEIPFTSVDHQNATISTAGRSTIQIPTRKKSIRAYYAIMRDAASISNPAVNDKLETYNYNSCQSFQWKVNNTQIPERVVDAIGAGTGGTEPFMYVLEAFREFSGYSTILTETVSSAQNFYSNKFVICYDFSSFSEAMSGLDTATFYSVFNLEITLGAVAVAQALEQFTVYDGVWKIDAAGKSTVES